MIRNRFLAHTLQIYITDAAIAHLTAIDLRDYRFVGWIERIAKPNNHAKAGFRCSLYPAYNLSIFLKSMAVIGHLDSNVQKFKNLYEHIDSRSSAH